MEIKLIIEPSAGLQKFLDALLGSGIKPAAAAPLKPVTGGATKTATAETKVTDEPVTLEKLQGLVAANKAKRDQIKAILGEHGAVSISTLDVAQYPEVYAKLLKL